MDKQNGLNWCTIPTTINIFAPFLEVNYCIDEKASFKNLVEILGMSTKFFSQRMRERDYKNVGDLQFNGTSFPGISDRTPTQASPYMSISWVTKDCTLLYSSLVFIFAHLWFHLHMYFVV